MKKIFGALLALYSALALSATTMPVQLLNPTGSTSGQAIISTGSSSAPAWGGIGVNGIAAIGANTVLGNATAASASPTALSMPSCSGAGNNLQWTASTGFNCATGYALTTNPLSQFASTTSAQLASVISDETGSGSAVFATGSVINPTSTGVTTPGIGAFTTLNASGNDAMAYSNVSAQSIANNAFTTVTGWTKTFDRLNANFNATTGTFTAPATGYYQISAGVVFASHTGVVAAEYAIEVLANGSAVAQGNFFQESVSADPVAVSVSTVVSLTAGQTAIIQVYQNSGAAVALLNSTVANYLSINRVP